MKHDWHRTGDGLSLTASFGVAERNAYEEVESWIARADKAMYASKAEGRNRVTVA